MFNFGWWRDKDNREGAKTIVDVLKIVVPAACVAGAALWGFFHVTEDAPAPAPAVSVTTGDNSPVAIGNQNTQSVTSD